MVMLFVTFGTAVPLVNAANNFSQLIPQNKNFREKN